MSLIPFAMATAEWICLDDDGVNPRGCRMKVAWKDAVMVEDDAGRLIGVLHQDCAEPCHEWAFDEETNSRYCVSCPATDTDPPTSIRFERCVGVGGNQ